MPLPSADGLTTVTDDAGAHWRVLARTVRPRVQGRLVVSTPLAPLEQRLRDLRRVIALAALAGLIALALATRVADGARVAPTAGPARERGAGEHDARPHDPR